MDDYQDEMQTAAISDRPGRRGHRPDQPRVGALGAVGAPPSGPCSHPPTASDVAQWKEEADSFLQDISGRLNRILAEIGRNLTAAGGQPQSAPRQSGQPDQPTRPANAGWDDLGARTAFDSPADVEPEDFPQSRESTQSGSPSHGDDRLTALKAQLARKLHQFEETSERNSEAGSGTEVVG